jgi:hypothetical protein
MLRRFNVLSQLFVFFFAACPLSYGEMLVCKFNVAFKEIPERPDHECQAHGINMTTMYDGRSFSHSHHLCQLPTPRSSIESSEPEGRPPSFISTAKEWESPTNPENSLQTPSSSTTSLDIPAPVVKPSPPRTHGGDGVVDDVKYYLKGQHQSNVQVCKAQLV